MNRKPRFETVDEFRTLLDSLLKEAARAKLCPLCCCWHLFDAGEKAYQAADERTRFEHNASLTAEETRH